MRTATTWYVLLLKLLIAVYYCTCTALYYFQDLYCLNPLKTVLAVCVCHVPCVIVSSQTAAVCVPREVMQIIRIWCSNFAFCSNRPLHYSTSIPQVLYAPESMVMIQRIACCNTFMLPSPQVFGCVCSRRCLDAMKPGAMRHVKP